MLLDNSERKEMEFDVRRNGEDEWVHPLEIWSDIEQALRWTSIEVAISVSRHCVYRRLLKGDEANCRGRLQSEKQCYVRFLLPTLVTLRRMLNALRCVLKLKSSECLLDALCGIESRFTSYFERRDLLLASVTVPHWRWLKTESKGCIAS